MSAYRPSQSDKEDLHPFLHDIIVDGKIVEEGVPHYLFGTGENNEGWIIPSRVYHQKVGMYATRDELLFHNGKRLDMIQQKNEQLRMKREPVKDIHTYSELVEHVLTLLPAEKVKFIREKIGSCKTMAECYELFPAPYGYMLSWYNSHREWREKRKQRGIAQVIAQQLPTMDKPRFGMVDPEEMNESFNQEAFNP